MKRLLALVLLVLTSLKCFSTCIVIYIADNGHIYVAADSRRSFIFNQNNKSQFESVCKIHNVGSSYFAIAGIDDSSLLKNATVALKENSQIDSAIKVFGTTMVKHYDKLMTETKLYYPDKFKHFLKEGLASVSFFGFFDGSPTIKNVDFLCSVGKDGKVISRYRLRKVYNITVIGISQDIRSEELPAKQVIEQNPELFVESLVKIEAKKQPLAVSEPIDLLELKENSAVWLRKNEEIASY